MLKKLQSEVLEATIQHDLSKLKQLFSVLDDAEKHFTTEEGKNLLHFISNQKNEHTLPILQFLLDSGLDPQAVDENYESPMDVAKKNNNIPALTLMKLFVYKRNQELQNYL